MKLKIENKDKRFPKGSLELEPGILNLIGCNGSGKTDLIHQILFAAEKLEDVVVFNMADFVDSVAAQEVVQDTLYSSSGETAYKYVTEFIIDSLATADLKHRDKNVLLLMDDVDTHLSIDAIRRLVMFMKYVVEEESKKRKLYIVMSGTNPVLAEDVESMDVTAFKKHSNVTFRRYCSLIASTIYRVSKKEQP